MDIDEPSIVPTSPVLPVLPDLEASLEDSLPIVDIEPEEPSPLTFEIVKPIHRKEKLFDSLGYSYNIKRQRGETIDWQCTIRRKDTRCPASVIQRPGSLFIPGKNQHSHLADVGSVKVAKICSRVKTEAVNNLFKPAPGIVHEVLTDEITDAPCPSLPKVEHICRAANRLRQKLRPTDPIDLDFEVDETHIPTQFLHADVKVKNRRHLVFASNDQLHHLSSAKTWYIDGTFKLCRPPFTQLFTINVFVRRDECAKQVPMVLVLMSGRKTNDYKKVLKAINDALPIQPSLTRVTHTYKT
ncbi:hypothetical protein QZH41_004303 [Actinostola sp. cb2023]|nr:hypothetical protein QZH41_004303 [Actinostola sp. cb2023]